MMKMASAMCATVMPMMLAGERKFAPDAIDGVCERREDDPEPQRVTHGREQRERPKMAHDDRSAEHHRDGERYEQARLWSDSLPFFHPTWMPMGRSASRRQHWREEASG